MKVLVGLFSSESNEHSKSFMTFEKFVFRYGEDLIDHMHVRDLFEDAGIELIPSIFAYGHPHGPITQDAFEFILSRFKQEVEDNLNEVDGIFLFLHGASKVVGLEGTSGEHMIVSEIRKITGPHLPIALVMDPHGNLSNALVDNVQILRCYRHSPHTDIRETYRFVAEKFIDLLKNRRNIHPVYRQVPIIIGGEKSVSSDEPMVSINRMLDEVEKSDRIMSASYHIGYLRHDGDKLGNSVIVVPNSEKDIDYANEVADQIKKFAFSKRKEFHFHGNYGEVDEAMRKAVEFDGSPVFITDSGDNCGSGGDGFNTLILRQILDLKDFNNKNYLVSGIVDKNAYAYLYRKDVGEKVNFKFGMDVDDLSRSVNISGFIVAKGIVHERYLTRKDIGTSITVKLDNVPVSVVVEYDAIAYTDLAQFKLSNIEIEKYDVIVVKQGYISDDFKKYGKFSIMSLTQGPTYQKSEQLYFKRIIRPMFPYDEFELE